MADDGRALNEARLASVWRYFSDAIAVVAIMTAFCDDHDQATNFQRNITLTADIRNLKYGHLLLDGFWLMDLDGYREKRVAEECILVSASAKNSFGFAENIHKLGNEYGQDAVLLKDRKGVRLIFMDGAEQKLENIQPGGLGEIYQLLRSDNGTFTFDGERESPGFIIRLGSDFKQRQARRQQDRIRRLEQGW